MIRIALADDHKMFARGLESLLEEEEDMEILGVFANGKELLDFLSKNPVDIVLTDMNMPLMDGMAVLQEVGALYPKTKVIVLSMYADVVIFEKSKKLGAAAYVLKDADPDELKYTIREVYEGSYIMSFQKVLAQNEDEPFGLDAFKEKFKLSRRELQILRMIKDGLMNKEIADQLHLSIHTVESHRKNIHQKLGVSTAVDLVKKAIEMNL